MHVCDIMYIQRDRFRKMDMHIHGMKNMIILHIIAELFVGVNVHMITSEVAYKSTYEFNLTIFAPWLSMI